MPSRTLRSWNYPAIALLLVSLASRLHAAPPPVDPEQAKNAQAGLKLFKGQVAGLLNSHCVKCHGGKKTEGDLDLTSREGLLQGGAEGAAIVPGKSQDSLLLKLIAHREEPHMPYEEVKLPDDAVQAIARWIDLGAPYDKPLVEKAKAPKGRPVVTEEDKKFWAFLPLNRREPPTVKNEAWCRTIPDRFVLAAQENAGIAGNPPADRRKLIRRVYFDLLGLPPKPAEIEAFVADPAPDAYEKLVDRLLASPHFGERWARHWLDLARFAESHGYEQDYDRPNAYHYRDFVIQAFNEDMAYDRFVKLQIAGDELEPENAEAMKATGYLAAGTHATQITANQAEKERYDELDDMAAVIGTSMLGITIGCARCHDHKFDPIPQEDYYRFVSTFTTTVRSDYDIDLNPARTRQRRGEWEQQHAPLAAELAQFEAQQLPGRLQSWLASNPKPPEPRWLVTDLESKSAGGAQFARQSDGSYLVSGNKAKHDTYTLVARTPLRGMMAVRVEALAHASLVKNGPGRAANGNFALTDFSVTIEPLENGAKVPPVAVKLINAKATFEQAGLPVAAAIDDNKTSGWAVDPQFGKDHAAVFEFESPQGFEGGSKLTFTLKFENNEGHSIGRPRLSLTTVASPVALDGETDQQNAVLEIASILKLPADQRSEQQRATLLAWFKTTDADWRKLNQKVEESLAKAPQPELTKVLISSEGVPAVRLHTQGPDFYEKTFFLKRGDLNQKQGEATQSFLQVLMRAPEKEKRWITPPPAGVKTSFRRTSLANWITDHEAGAGHLLARVIVNRLWQHHMGRGIVATPSDFGVQGEPPTHPELLDWLATELIRGGWKLKPLHKLLVTSAVYMQSSDFDDQRAKIDPDNKLFWRRGTRRLEGEAIRDAMLSASGTLDERMFGPGSLDEGHKRRSIYFTTKRSQLIPIMMLFDAPDSLTSLGQRSATTIAPQALAMMNNPHVQSYARQFARQLLPAAEKSTEEAIRSAYLTTLGRLPVADEMSDTREFIAAQTKSYRERGKSEALELALTDFCRTLFSLNEFIFVD